jgi:HEAT repeat protein
MLRDGESVERLHKLYTGSNDVELLRFTAIALGLIGDRSIINQMVSLLDDATPDITRTTTAYNLGLVGDRKAIDPLWRIAMDENENSRMRKFAILGLGLVADENPEPSISKITRDNNYTIIENFLCELYNIN